jgi:hypothetical protein
MSETTIDNPASGAVAEFSLLRLFWLIRNRISRDLIPLSIGAAIIAGLNLLFMLIAPHQAFFNATKGVLWTTTVMGASFIMAATAFREMQSGKSGTDWLLLPATTMEKYLAALLELVILLPLAILLLASALSALLAGIQGLAGAASGEIWTPLQWNHPAIWGSYLVTTLLFLTGSAVFRKQAFIKTMGVQIAFALVIALLLTGGGWLLLTGNLRYNSADILVTGDFSGVMNVNGKNSPPWLGPVITWLWSILWFGITPVLALAFGYFRLREKEAKDAVQ